MGIESKYIWFNGDLVDWHKAKVHVLTHALHYGSSIFEGIRCYANTNGTGILRLEAHVERMFDSTRIYRMVIPYTRTEISQAIIDTIKANELEECYIRPLVFRGLGSMGVNPLNNPIDVVIAVWEWGEYLGEESITEGVDVCVSSWARIAPNTLPVLSKASANYMNSQLVKMEAILGGFKEGIVLDTDGFVSEGSGENLFLISNGILYTAPVSGSILPGITRQMVIQIALDEGLEVREELISRERLYLADELFFTGTASEVTPIRSVDRMDVGEGGRGAITRRIQESFFGILRGTKSDTHGWLTYI